MAGAQEQFEPHEKRRTVAEEMVRLMGQVTHDTLNNLRHQLEQLDKTRENVTHTIRLVEAILNVRTNPHAKPTTYDI